MATTKKVSPKAKKVVKAVAAVSSSSNDNSSKSVITPGGGVVVLSRIPHGFYEDQMRAYFGQFGEITRLRLSRNRRTGASKHYAFIEFRHSAVARIVADTMNNYLLMGRLLQCQVVPEDKLHPECFEGADRKFTAIPWTKISRQQHNAEKSVEKIEKSKKKQSKKLKSLEDQCKELGINWDAKDL